MNPDQVFEKLDQSVKQSINTHRVQGKKIYTIDPSAKLSDNLLEAHYRAEQALEGPIDDIIERMISNKAYRNFICVNFQHFLWKSSDNNLVETRNFGNNTIREARKFGFKTDNKNILDDGQLESFLQDLTTHYERYYNSYLYNNFSNLDYNKHLFDPIIWTADTIGVHNDAMTVSSDYVYLDGENQVVNSFLTLLTISKFYERYINQIIKEGLECDNIISNPAILYAKPTSKGPIHKYAELDGFLVSKNNETYIIECKNSKTINQKYVSKFLGKSHLIEEIYGIELDKLFVSTGSPNSKIQGLKRMKTGSLKIFDFIDHKNGYKRLLDTLS